MGKKKRGRSRKGIGKFQKILKKYTHTKYALSIQNIARTLKVLMRKGQKESLGQAPNFLFLCITIDQTKIMCSSEAMLQHQADLHQPQE